VTEDSLDSGDPPANSMQGIWSGLDWNSELKEIIFCVELPFWLLMPSCQLPVEYKGFSTTVIIEHEGIEIQRGNQLSRGHSNTIFIGGKTATRDASFSLRDIWGGTLVRTTRALLYINTYAISDAIDALFNCEGPRRLVGHRYFASLAQGHLPIVNEVINAYRRASIDPYANEVTAWDVPRWIVCHHPVFESVSLFPHLINDEYPKIGEGEKENDYFATDEAALKKHLSQSINPGEIEMLDGWSLFHRGRYGDSIRSFVTAIEVLLESEIRRILSERGTPEEEIENRLENTRSNFDKRLEDYRSLSKRRVPGPILHCLPYINGVRLDIELDYTRKLRHRIVHHGHRLDHEFVKPMQRAAETTSWLFDWLLNNGDFESRRNKNHVFFFGLHTSSTLLPCVVENGILIVKPPPWHDPIKSEQIQISFNHVVHTDEILLCTISSSKNGGKDVEHFTKMAFFELGLGEIEDCPYEISEIEQHPISERFFTEHLKQRILFFVLDCAELLDKNHINQVINFLTEKYQDGNGYDHAILVSNDQMDVDWSRRSGEIDETEINKLACPHQLSIIRTADLAKIVLAVINHNWNSELTVSGMLQPGLQGSSPPHSTQLGSIYHFWDKHRIVGIQLEDSQSLSKGDLLALKLSDHYYQHELNDFKIDEENKLTFQIDLQRSQVPIGSKVFLLDQTKSIQVEPENGEIKEESNQES